MGKVLDKILDKLGFVGHRLATDEEAKEFFEKVDLLELKLHDCRHGYSIGDVIKLANDSEQEFPIKEKCDCYELYKDVKENRKAFKEKYQK